MWSKKGVFVFIFLLVCGSTFLFARGSREAADPVKEGVRVVSIGISNTSMPNAYLDEDGNLAGQNYEVMNLVEEMLTGYKFDYYPLEQSIILTGLDTGIYAVGVFNAFWNPARAEKYLFPKYPVAGGVQGVILHKDNKDIITGGTTNEILSQIAAAGFQMTPVSPGGASDSLYAKFNKTHDPGIRYSVSEMTDVATATRYVLTKRYEGSVWLASNYDRVKDEVDPEGRTFFLPFNDGGFGTWVIYGRGEKELVAAVDEAMAELFRNGTMAAISLKYYGENVFQYIDDFEYADVEPNPNYK